MDGLDNTKLERIGRQAMNIQMIEAVFKTVDSDGIPIDGTERPRIFLYNLEKISAEEVEKVLENDGYMFDTRLLEGDPERVANIFPHAGESKKDPRSVYWEPVDITKCKCSECGMTVNADDAVERDFDNLEKYKKIRYRFCPNCGSAMSIREEKEHE